MVCKQCFGKKLTELADGSDNDVNAWWYYRLQADRYTAIDMAHHMGELEATPVMHAVISGPTSVRTDREVCFSLANLGENMTLTTPLTQLSMDSDAMEIVLISESTQASDDGALLHIASWQATKQSYHASNAWSNCRC